MLVGNGEDPFFFGIHAVEQLREPPQGLGPEDQVHMAVGGPDLLRHLRPLGHAAAQADDALRPLLLDVDQLAHHAEDLLLRVLPDGAGVDEDDVRQPGVLGKAAAHLPQHAHHALAVRHILLAAVGVHHSQGPAVPGQQGGHAPGIGPLALQLAGGNDDLCSVQGRSPCFLINI